MSKNSSTPEKEKSMSVIEKLHDIDQEIQLLLDFCIKSNFDHHQIKENALPLLNRLELASRKKWLYRLIGFVTFIVTIVGLYYFDPLHTVAYVYGRYVSLKILPIWDWTEFYYSNCLMENPFYSGNMPKKEDCRICEDLVSIERFHNVSWQEMTDLLKNDIPIIVEDGLRNWDNLKDNLTISELIQIYLDQDNLRDASPCVFTSNFRVKENYRINLLTRILDDDLKKWYMHWENCEKAAAKAFRPYYKRPYFLPPMVENSESNWIFLSSEYTARNFKEILFTTSMLWFAQVYGENTIQLSPKEPCSEICPVFRETLKENEVLVVTGFLWKLDYLPMNGNNVAIAVGGYAD